MILSSIIYTDIYSVKYNDGFLHMHQMEEARNMNIADKFNSSWINVLEKSMIEWFNKYASVFMCIWCKTNHLGTSVLVWICSLTPIFWISQISEGKYHPQQLGQK